jgi:hypothetical protein
MNPLNDLDVAFQFGAAKTRAAACSPRSSGGGILTAQTSALKGAETGIKIIAAVHSRCPFWVKSGQTIAGKNPQLSVVTPIADKRGRGLIVR